MAKPAGRILNEAKMVAAYPKLVKALREAIQDCSCSVGERASGHHVDCRAPGWKELLDELDERHGD